MEMIQVEITDEANELLNKVKKVDEAPSTALDRVLSECLKSSEKKDDEE